MRNAIIQCLFYGSLTFGIWTALLFIYLHHNHVSNQQKKSQEPLSAWSSGKKVHQQIIYGSEQIPKRHVTVKRTDEDKTKSMLGTDFNHTNPELHKELLQYGFNVIISRSLGIEREVPDTRSKMCLQKHYPARLPTASVVICFYNEEFNALFRTVSSVMNLTPHYFLEEIILVDDMSKVGDVLVFLDSHCEVNREWLEPLLHAIAKDPKMVVCPLIDVIDDRTLEYKPSPVVRGTFDWNLQFKWDNVFSYEMDGPEGPTKPIRSPAMSGGIFAIRRHYFNEIGQYDKDMDFWGGENLELSLRIWMCGGQLFIIPCSRVGHISKKQTGKPSTIISAMTHNYLRLVHVWLDEYKEQFFLRKPGLKYVTYGNIRERVELRKRLGCKSFQWYLDNVFPELEASVNSS
ncbi:inactive polypeptide N-acetylgalactosaminyltransferase-like protein 5 isoform X2 [Pongo pygmaeus]|uniref:inactive polypeptide N-acetylgalactosaminyltransferase-like protein 5 isoform X2 n=1 Tax=Pongo pygmaeus TaxID=9600 RepID=UPI0023E2ABCB|nr:inactive polypeptide N-acetylgalactosaminyltransferase-like protein 5 isoform X2 [Pongo pygmaeus]XP_054351232.1 inactive polypeptide N-acetylgalactosaminyltransferase-like protein 5 isoform X2 [Pongo pygmaeus]